MGAFLATVPVITSNSTSMPEVAGGAAILVDPFNKYSILCGMLMLYYSSRQYLELSEKGKIRCLRYTWDRTAALLWDSINKAI